MVVGGNKVTIGTGMPGSSVVAGAAVLVDGAKVVVAGAAVVVLGAAVEVMGTAVLETAVEVADTVVAATAAEEMSSIGVLGAAVMVAVSCSRRDLQHTCRQQAAPLHWLACCGGS